MSSPIPVWVIDKVSPRTQSKLFRARQHPYIWQAVLRCQTYNRHIPGFPAAYGDMFFRQACESCFCFN